MKKHTKSIALALLCIAAPASADDWSGEVGGWDVGRSGDTCGMSMDFEGEGSTALTVIYRKENDTAYISVANYNWSAKEGESYDISYSFGEWYYEIPSLGIKIDYKPGFMTLASDVFLDDLAGASSIKLRLQDTLIDSLSLKGSAAAVAALKRCRAELRREAEQERRDKERLAHIPKDPFAVAKETPSENAVD